MTLPKLTQSLAAEIRRDLGKLPRLDEKRVALGQFIAGGELLARQKFDLIAYPVFSGLVPATLFNILYAKRHGRPLPTFEYATLSSLSKNNFARTVGDYQVIFSRSAAPILAQTTGELLVSAKRNELDLRKAKILLIDSNLASGITIACFVEVLDRLNFNFKNLTLLITDSRANDPKLAQAERLLLKGGKMVLLNQTNMTNKVFDNVLCVSAYASDRKNLKTLRRGKIVYDKKQLNFYPYFLALALLKQELKK